MAIRIVETSKEAFERIDKEQIKCPECKVKVYGGSWHIEHTGFLWMNSFKVTTYRCSRCRCKFEIKKQL